MGGLSVLPREEEEVGGWTPGSEGRRAERCMKSPYLSEGLVGLREVPTRGSLEAIKLEQSAPFLRESKLSPASTSQTRNGPPRQPSLGRGDILGCRAAMGCPRGK